MQSVIHYPSSSGIIMQWELDPDVPVYEDEIDPESSTRAIQDEIDRTSDETIIESIRRIDTKVFGEPDDPWTVLGISHTPGTTTIEAEDPLTKYTHVYVIMWWG